MLAGVELEPDEPLPDDEEEDDELLSLLEGLSDLEAPSPFDDPPPDDPLAAAASELEPFDVPEPEDPERLSVL